MIFFATEEELVKKLRKDDYGDDDKDTSDEWLVDNAFEQGWVSNFENLLDGFLYFETREERVFFYMKTISMDQN